MQIYKKFASQQIPIKKLEEGKCLIQQHNRCKFLKTSTKILGGTFVFSALGGIINASESSSFKPNHTKGDIMQNQAIQTSINQAKEGKRISAKGYGVQHKSDTFKPFEFSRHAMGENDILIEILYAGI